MIDKYEQAIKETFAYLDECIANQAKKDTFEYLYSLGIDKCFVIKNIMAKKGFIVNTNVSRDGTMIAVIPITHNLPSHLWKQK